MPIEKICQLCSSKYFVIPSKVNKTKYCSKKCAGTVSARRNGKIKTERCSSKEHLLSKVKVDKNGCWIWQAGKNKKGYGNKKYKGKQTKAHRFFYEVFIGKIPKGMCVLHRCDNPSCCNSGHLFLGTIQDNNEDMYKKKRNRSLKGEKHPKAKLTEKDVLEIRRLHKEGLTYKTISEKFPISESNVSSIVNRKSWPHI